MCLRLSWYTVAGEKLTIPLTHTRRSEFSGATLSLKTMGAVFERAPAFNVSLTADTSQAVLDTAALKAPSLTAIAATLSASAGSSRSTRVRKPKFSRIARSNASRVASLKASVSLLEPLARRDALPQHRLGRRRRSQRADSELDEAESDIQSSDSPPQNGGALRPGERVDRMLEVQKDRERN